MRIDTIINEEEFQELSNKLSADELRKATRAAMRRAGLAGRVAGSRMLRKSLDVSHKLAKKRFRFQGNVKETSLPLDSYYLALKVGKKGELVNKFRASVESIRTKRGPNVNVSYDTPSGKVSGAGFIFHNKRLVLEAHNGMMVVRRKGREKMPVEATHGPSASGIIEAQDNVINLKNVVEKRYQRELKGFISFLATGRRG